MSDTTAKPGLVQKAYWHLTKFYSKSWTDHRTDIVDVKVRVHHTDRNLTHQQGLSMACCAVQWTGINTIIFYAPQLFITLGASQRASLAATIVTGIVNHFATYVSLWAADEFGRRVLFIEGGIQMAIALVSHLPMAYSQRLKSCKAYHFAESSLNEGLLWQMRMNLTPMSPQAIIGTTLAITGAQVWAAWFVLAIMCIYISAYAWSWGPLGWLYSSEVQPLETRSAGQSITTLVNLMFSFVIGQVRLPMCCAVQTLGRCRCRSAALLRHRPQCPVLPAQERR